MFSQLHIFLNDGKLLTNGHNRDFYSSAWKLARADSFESQVANVRNWSKADSSERSASGQVEPIVRAR